jgi:hypothetical protein
MEPDEKPDLMRDLQRTCRKLEAAILECERLLSASPLVLAPEGVLPEDDAEPAERELGSPEKVQR